LHVGVGVGFEVLQQKISNEVCPGLEQSMPFSMSNEKVFQTRGQIDFDEITDCLDDVPSDMGGLMIK